MYRAFLELYALAKWPPSRSLTCTVHQLDADVSGKYRKFFRSFTARESHSFGGEYVELVPNERLRYNDRFEDLNFPGEIQITVTLKPVTARDRTERCTRGTARRDSSQGLLCRVAGFT